MEGDSCLQTQRVWQRLGEGVDPSGEESPSRVGRGLCKSPIQGRALCLPQSPALPLPHICTPPTATWRDRWLLPGLGCQLKLLNKAFAKSTPCSSGSPWLIEERPSSSSVFLDNVSSPSSLTHSALFQATFIIPHTHMPGASLCASHTVLRRFFLPSLCCSCLPPPAPHPPPGMPFFQPTPMLPNHLCLQESPDRSPRRACSCPALNVLCDTVAQPDLVL